ncbi:MAG: histidine kinase [Hydrocarboniphaga sp.]|uniref:ATP-binding response regulator n=1 Tax=Hydrocarboniphaga sp. TaxID=2033016 RepID=UPI00261F1545|nr:hybrid sensor histidine kinase/response regulator [Hydrocarboniphaga sp.]MDB5968193.1 histidine kinase [Hydrocarboniphaga sp.]
MKTSTQQSWSTTRRANSTSITGSITGSYSRTATLQPGPGITAGGKPVRNTWSPQASTASQYLPPRARGSAGKPERTAQSRLRLHPLSLPREVLLAPVPALLAAAALSLWISLHAADPIGETSQKARLLAAQAAPLVAESLAGHDLAAVAKIIRSLNREPESVQLRVTQADGRIAAEDGQLIRHGQPIDEAHRVGVDKPIFDERQPKRAIGNVQVDMALPAETAQARRMPLMLAAVTGLLVGLSLLAGAWLARRRSAPVRVLASAMQRLSEGQLDVDIAVTEEGELGRLQRGLNATALTLRGGLGQLDQQIRRATTLLARKNAELEAANVAKTRFLAAASHDLRQPLHALNLFTANLREGEHDAARLQRIGHVQECVESLDRLFTGLLDVSRLDAGAERPVETCFALDALFVEVSQNFRSLAEERGLRLIVRQTPLWIRADRGMLARVLNNLVCNAIRYTPSGGVLLGARLRGQQVRIDVWDTGVGIATEHQMQIFDEFVRFADCSGDRGLGLGLATVKRLCSLMKAPLDFRSIPGSGTAFNLLLPRADIGRAASRSLTLPGEIHGLRVLVIDDETTILEGTQALLQSWGCDTLVAESLEDAQRRIADSGFVPDLVISDLRLRKNQNGIDAIHAIRANSIGREPAALLITGETCPIRAKEAAQLKLPLLCKPVAPAALKKAIAATMLQHANP